MRREMNSFMKNIATVGGMLYVRALDSGASRQDARKSRKRVYLH